MFLAESQLANTYEDELASMRTLFVGFVGFTVYIWDHLITFGDEVDLIWTGKKGLPIYLFLINRYLTPLGFIINLVAYTLPSWKQSVSFVDHLSRCGHFVRFEGAMTAIGIELAGLMMLLRVRAMYPGKNPVIAAVLVIFAVWVGVTAWLLAGAGPVDHNGDGVHSCTMIFSSSANRAAAASTAWLPLLYDTVVFGLTLYRTLPHILHKQAGFVIHSLFADGLLYYSVICCINLVLTIMIVRAPPGLQNITAQLELLVTVTMMSRITLNIRKKDRYGDAQTIDDDSSGIITSDTTRLQSRHSSQTKSFSSRSASAFVPPAINYGNYSKRPGSADSDMSDSPTIRVSDPFEVPPRRKRLSTILDMSLAGSPLQPSSPVDHFTDEELRLSPTQDLEHRAESPGEVMLFASPPPSARSASVHSTRSPRREEFEDDLRFFVRESDRNARLARRQHSECEDDLRFENPHSARADLFPHHEGPEDDDTLRYYVPNSNANDFFSRRRWTSDNESIPHPYSSRSESFQLRPVSARSAAFSFSGDVEAQSQRLSRTLPVPPPIAAASQTPNTPLTPTTPRTLRALPQTPIERVFGLPGSGSG
ncbi:hypothetical protein CONPUDRAFT_153655 [Coniophora puteana RWD-64-598 SS2]|uniref:DUF6533 domain-containing protein n=1 Tax=Coniophora puteana (strain RWD-64-598) TaxID=741705 RepID=A0A5M3MPX1_CONPW|nr:uncharacterized protein CONPUDRAFT_153655 [Coniophora puteana RWD-64-598 SS2]EIW81106.1 hypothetical protein CONPUDRAFT_153655 [Coniophora puteana RWD-64-598 SS2]